MTTETAGLTIKEAFEQAEADQSVVADGGEPTSTPAEPANTLEVEQPAVETEAEDGLFDVLVDTEEQPEEDSFSVTINGQETNVTKDELLSGYMRQADYTQKTQELANLGREAEKALTLMKLLEEQPVETVRKLYQTINSGAPIAGMVEANVTIPSSDPQTAPTDVEALVAAQVAEILANDPNLVSIQSNQALAQVNSVFAEIEEMYNVTLSDSDKEQTLLAAQKYDTDDLKFVFGGLMNQAAQKREALVNAKNAAPAAPTSADPTTPPSAANQKYDSFRSALEATIAEQGAETFQL
jgi:hypothetical protein